ncbi:Orf120b protein, partial [Striga asiatica]
MEDEVVHKLTSFQLSEKEAKPIAIDVSDTHISAEVCKRSLFGKIHGQKKAQLPRLRRALAGKCIRLLVTIDLNQPLLRCASLMMQNRKILVEFKYEKLVSLCFYCGFLGHQDRNCDIRSADINNASVKEGLFGDWLRAQDYPHLHHNSSHTSNSESPKPSTGSPSKPSPSEKASSLISEPDHQPSHKPSSPQPNLSPPIIPSPPSVHSIPPINSQSDQLMVVDTLCPTANPSHSTPLSSDLIPKPPPSIKARKWRRKPNSKATLNSLTIPPTSPIVT